MEATFPRLLLGERDPFMQRTLKQTLQGHFELTFVEDGAVLLARARQNAHDLILLEVLLPTLDGFQVCRQLKNDPITRPIPVLFYTLLAAEVRARQAGADGFLQKPQPPTRIIEEIRRILELPEKRDH
jgi:putative two-component system response regulator